MGLLKTQKSSGSLLDFDITLLKIVLIRTTHTRLAAEAELDTMAQQANRFDTSLKSYPEASFQDLKITVECRVRQTRKSLKLAQNRLLNTLCPIRSH